MKKWFLLLRRVEERSLCCMLSQNEFLKKIHVGLAYLVFGVLLFVSFLEKWSIKDCYTVLATSMFIYGSCSLWLAAYAFFSGPKAYNPNPHMIVRFFQIVGFCAFYQMFFSPFFVLLGAALFTGDTSFNDMDVIAYLNQLLLDIQKFKIWILMLTGLHLIGLPSILEYQFTKKTPTVFCYGALVIGLAKIMGIVFLSGVPHAIIWVKLWSFVPISFVLYPFNKLMRRFIGCSDKVASTWSKEPKGESICFNDKRVVKFKKKRPQKYKSIDEKLIKKRPLLIFQMMSEYAYIQLDFCVLFL